MGREKSLGLARKWPFLCDLKWEWAEGRGLGSRTWAGRGHTQRGPDGRVGGAAVTARSLCLPHLSITYLSTTYPSINQPPTYRETVGIPGYL